jgi:hypothetical protein
MRVLIIGSRNPWRMEMGILRALRRVGHVTKLFDDRSTKRLVGSSMTQRLALLQAKRFKADLVLLSKCHALDPETVAEIIDGKPNAMWYHDPQWFRSTYRPDVAHIVKIGKLAQTFFVTGFEEQWAALGLRAKFLPACGDVAIKPVKPQQIFASDIAFIGTGYDPARANFLLKIARKHDLKVWGLGWREWRKPLKWTGRAVEGKEFAAVCSSSKIVLGINPSHAKGSINYTSDRTWMVILGGGFYLGEGAPGLREMLRDGDHCAWYSDIESCLSQCGYYLENAAARERIRREGYAFVRKYHTFDQRIDNLLSGEAFVNPLA